MGRLIRVSEKTDFYWASLEGTELATRALTKIQDHFRVTNDSLHRQRILKACNYYYGLDDNTPSYALSAGGEGGELTFINVNYLRYLLQHKISMVSGGRLTYKAIPQNTDVTSREQAILANGILAAYARDLRLERLFARVTEYALITGEGFVRVTWDPSIGEEAFVNELGESVRAGDVRVDAFSYWDVIREEDVPSHESDWIIVREFRNKWDLAAKYPEHREAILAMSAVPYSYLDYTGISNSPANRDTNHIPVYTLYHKPTPAVPQGKECTFLSSEVVLFSGELPYSEIPVYRMSPSDVLCRPVGYTPVFDVLSVHEAYNNLLSAVLSNQHTLAHSKIWTQKGDDLSVKEVGTGIMNLQTSGAKPEALNLLNTSREVFDTIEMLRNLMVSLLGLNDTALGVQSQRLSGSAMAILDQKAVQFSAAEHEAYTHMVERVGGAIIELVKDHADSPRVVTIIGKKQKYMTRSFTAEDLSDVNRVVVETVSPELRSFAVRYDLATQWLQGGLVTDKATHMEMITTGQIELETEDEINQNVLIDKENELMRGGALPEDVPTLAIDRHIQHIIKHSNLLSDPDLRLDPNISSTVLAHIDTHIQMLITTNPELLMILGQNPSQLNQQMQAVQGQVPNAPSPEEAAIEAQGIEADSAAQEASGELEDAEAVVDTANAA